MRRFLGILVCLLGLAMPAFAQIDALQGYCTQGGSKAQTQGMGSSNHLQGVINGCTVTVYLTGTLTKATIFSNNTGTPLTNPFTANIAGVNPGSWIFWAADSTGYDVVLSGGNANPNCNTAPLCYTSPVTIVDLKVGGGGGGGSGCGTSSPCLIPQGGTGATAAQAARFNLNIPAISVLDYGAVGDAQIVKDGAMGSGSATLTSASGLFTPSSCGSGKVVSVQYAGGTGGSNQPLVSSCTYVNSTTLTLGATATQSVTGAGVIWGTDNYPAFNAWMAALPGNRGLIPCSQPTGQYLINTKQGALTLNFGSKEFITMDQSCQIDYVGGLLGAGITPLFTIPPNTHHVYIDSFHVVGEWQSTATLTGVFEGFGNATVIEGQNNTGGSSDIQIVNPLFEHILGQGVKEFNYGTDSDVQVRNGRFLNVADTAMNVNTSNSVLDNNLCQNDPTGGGGCIEASGGNSQYTNNKSYYTTYNYSMQFGGLTGSAPPFTGSHVEGNQVYFPIGTQGCYSFNSGFTYGVIAHNTCYGVTNLGMVAANSGTVLSGYNKYIGNIMQGTNSILNSVTSISAGTGSGTVFLTNFNNGCTGSTATVTLASGAFSSATVTAGGTLCNIEPTFANCANGTATCAGSTVSVTTTLTAGGTGFYIPGSPGNEFYGNSTTGVGFGYNQQDGDGNVSEGNNWWGSAYDITLISVTTSMKDRAQHCRISLNSGATLSVDSVITAPGTYCESTFPSTFVAPVQSPGFWTSFGTTGASTNIPGFSNAGSWNIAALFNRQASQGDISSPMALDFGETNAGTNNRSHNWIQTEYNGNFSGSLALFTAQTGNAVIAPNASMAGLRLISNVTTGPSFTAPNTYVFLQGGGPSEGMGANVGSSLCMSMNGTPCTDPGQGAIGYASFLRGPSTAPTGSCSTIGVGVWEFTQDGIGSYCNGSSWTTPFASGGSVTSVNSNTGALVLNFSSGAGSCAFSSGTTTCTFTGSGSGGGTVTNFIASTGSWPTWLVPSVATSTTTPTLSVSASAIPNSALANPATTVGGATCTLGSSCTPFISVISGITVSGTPSSGQILTATSSSAANWQTLAVTAVSGVTVSGTPTAGQALVAATGSTANWQNIVNSVSTDGSITASPTTGTPVFSINLAHANAFTALQGFGGGVNLSGGTAPFQLGGSAGSLGQCPISQGAGVTPIWGSCVGSGSVSSITNSDGTLTISPTTGAAVASINEGHTNAWTAIQTFGAGLNLTEIAALTGSVGIDRMWGDSTKHAIGVNLNNAGTRYLAYAVGTASSGNGVQWASDGVGLVDCGSPTCGGGGGSPAFSAITSGTNTTAAMVIGSGASISVSGTGTNAATSAPYSGLTGSVPTWNQSTTGNAATATNLAGTPALPNGTTATTQTTTDTTTDLATDAFVHNVFNAGVSGTTNFYGLFSATHVIGAGHISDNGTVITATLPISTGSPVLFSALTSCASGISGTIAAISDPSATPTFWTGAAGTGTPGATSAPVYCDGATWRYY